MPSLLPRYITSPPSTTYRVNAKGRGNDRRPDNTSFHPGPLAQNPVQSGSSTRLVSAGFMDGPSTCHPILATSSITASNIPSAQKQGKLSSTCSTPRHTRKITPSNIPLPKLSSEAPYATATGRPYGLQNNENVPLNLCENGTKHTHKKSFDIAAAKLQIKSKAGPLISIPKSNTVNVFSNLTTAFSRNSMSRFSRSTSVSSVADSEARSSFASRSTTELSPGDLDDPHQIHTAQPSAYWSGRFVALQDRFHSEMMWAENLATLTTAFAEQSNVMDNMPLSSATNQNFRIPEAKGHRYSISNSTFGSKGKSRASSRDLDAIFLMEEGNRELRAFRQLDALCTTSDARQSLHAWQQSYARRMGKKELLPKGGSMDDRGWMGRLLGRDTGRRNSVASVAEWI